MHRLEILEANLNEIFINFSRLCDCRRRNSIFFSTFRNPWRTRECTLVSIRLRNSQAGMYTAHGYACRQASHRQETIFPLITSSEREFQSLNRANVISSTRKQFNILRGFRLRSFALKSLEIFDDIFCPEIFNEHAGRFNRILEGHIYIRVKHNDF